MDYEEAIALRVIQLEHELRSRESDFKQLHEELARLAERAKTKGFENPTYENGWFAVFHQNRDKSWRFVGFLREDMDEADAEKVECDGSLIIAIPDPESMPEWDGF